MTYCNNIHNFTSIGTVHTIKIRAHMRLNSYKLPTCRYILTLQRLQVIDEYTEDNFITRHILIKETN